MVRKGVISGIVATLIVVLGYWGMSSGAKDCGGLPAERVADFLYAVIQADRTFYTAHVVERLQTKGLVVASENWRGANTAPPPAHVFQEASRMRCTASAAVRT